MATGYFVAGDTGCHFREFFDNYMPVASDKIQHFQKIHNIALYSQTLIKILKKNVEEQVSVNISALQHACIRKEKVSLIFT